MTVPLGDVSLTGDLVVPEGARAVVLFAHGSGSSRHSPRNRYVSAVLNEAGIATLLFDLLTPGEEADRSNVFDILLLDSASHRDDPMGEGEPRDERAGSGVLRRQHRCCGGTRGCG